MKKSKQFIEQYWSKTFVFYINVKNVYISSEESVKNESIFISRVVDNVVSNKKQRTYNKSENR